MTNESDGIALTSTAHPTDDSWVDLIIERLAEADNYSRTGVFAGAEARQRYYAAAVVQAILDVLKHESPDLDPNSLETVEIELPEATVLCPIDHAAYGEQCKKRGHEEGFKEGLRAGLDWGRLHAERILKAAHDRAMEGIEAELTPAAVQEHLDDIVESG